MPVFELLDNSVYRKSKHGQNSLLEKEIRNGDRGGGEAREPPEGAEQVRCLDHGGGYRCTLSLAKLDAGGFFILPYVGYTYVELYF